MKGTLKHLISILTIITMIHNPVLAVPTNSQVQSQREQLQAEKTELKKAQEKRFEIEQSIENLDNQIEKVMREIENNQKQILKIQGDMKLTEQELKEAEENLEKEQALFHKRMRAMYMNGVDGYIEIIFNSTGVKDFLSRIEALKSIIEADKKITASIKLKQEELQVKKAKQNEQQKQLMAMNTENNKKMDKLKSSKAEQNMLIVEAERQERLLAAVVTDFQSRLNETIRQIQAIRDVTPRYTPSRGATSLSSNSVVAYASNFLGTPYLWGGTTPAGFDCSGFTQYVYKHFGISLGRTTYDQIKDGYAIPREALQPGDLVFYGKGGSPSHMGIYVGNGSYIHAPRTGDVVKISPYDRKDYITARRVR